MLLKNIVGLCIEDLRQSYYCMKTNVSSLITYMMSLQAGSVSFSPGFTCTDQDVGDTAALTYDLNPANNSQRFSINSAGVMTFKVRGVAIKYAYHYL